MKFVIVISVLAAGVIARPSDEKPQYPKKFDSSVHSDLKKKVHSKVAEESSYTYYDPTGDLEIMVPPRVSNGPFYESLYRYPSRFVYEVSVKDPSDSLSAPLEDTYSSPEGIPSDGLEVPLDIETAKDEPKSYISYSNLNRNVNLPMTAPEQSSYATLLSALVQLPLPLESELPIESELPTSLNVPSNTKQEPIESSYISFNPQQSTYADYNKNFTLLDVMQPPALA